VRHLFARVLEVSTAAPTDGGRVGGRPRDLRETLGEPPHHRAHGVAPAVRLHVPTELQATLQLSPVEKNWAPFVIDDAKKSAELEEVYYVHRWLARTNGNGVGDAGDPGGGSAGPSTTEAATTEAATTEAATTEALQIRVSDGRILQQYTSSAHAARARIGVAEHAIVSGGTPAVRLNRTTFLAIGHTSTRPCAATRSRGRDGGAAASTRCTPRNDTSWKQYAAFAYTFSAAPPFSLTAASRHFRLPAPRFGRTAHTGVKLTSVVERLQLLDARAPTLSDWHEAQADQDRWVQFPTGIVLEGGAAFISWGERDPYTVLTRVHLTTLLGMLQDVH
jgi:hypothetical protein